MLEAMQAVDRLIDAARKIHGKSTSAGLPESGKGGIADLRLEKQSAKRLLSLFLLLPPSPPCFF